MIWKVSEQDSWLTPPKSFLELHKINIFFKKSLHPKHPEQVKQSATYSSPTDPISKIFNFNFYTGLYFW